MRYTKLTFKQKRIKNWRSKRNHLVCQILDSDKSISREDALSAANRQLKKTKGRKSENEV